jgi:hypothetical protein
MAPHKNGIRRIPLRAAQQISPYIGSGINKTCQHAQFYSSYFCSNIAKKHFLEIVTVNIPIGIWNSSQSPLIILYLHCFGKDENFDN